MLKIEIIQILLIYNTPKTEKRINPSILNNNKNEFKIKLKVIIFENFYGTGAVGRWR